MEYRFPARPDPPRWYTSDEAAVYLALAPKTLRNWRSRRLGPPYHRIGANVRYAQTDLDAWLSKRRVGTREDM